MKWAVFNDDGFPTSFYSDDVNGSDIPAGAIQITDEQWLELLTNQGSRRWVYGEVVEYAPPAEAFVPTEVSRAQAKIALKRAGLLAAVKQKVEASEEETQIWFDDALNWRRDNSNVAALGEALGLTPSNIDDLFRQAAQIEA